MGEAWRIFWFFSRESLGFLFIPETVWISAVLFAHLAAALFVTCPFKAGRWKPSYWRVFYGFLFFPAMFALGAVGGVRGEGAHPAPNGFVLTAFCSLFFGPLVLGFIWVYQLKGVRWFAFAVVLIEEWVVVGAGFLVGMVLSGDWI